MVHWQALVRNVFSQAFYRMPVISFYIDFMPYLRFAFWQTRGPHVVCKLMSSGHIYTGTSVSLSGKEHFWHEHYLDLIVYDSNNRKLTVSTFYCYFLVLYKKKKKKNSPLIYTGVY